MKRLVFFVGLLVAANVGPASSQEVPQQLEGFNLEGYTDGGEKAWDVVGETADIKTDKIDINNVDANRYGEPNVNLKAKKGTINKASGNIHLERDVVITTESGEQLTTDTLDWQKDADLVTTEDFVTITGNDGMKTTGTGLEAHPGLRTAKLEKDVTVNVNTQPETQPGPENMLEVTCDGPMEIDQAKNLGIFHNNVVAFQAGRQLKADKMEIYFNPETQQVKQVICIGNVEISQGENKSFSDRAVYNAVDKKMILTGRPKLIMVTEGPGSIGEMNKSMGGEETSSDSESEGVAK